MKDGALLELAAKAAGIECSYDKNGLQRFKPDDYWNPLTDDGDAFRLACTLGLSVDINNAFYKTTVIYDCGDDVVEDHKLGTTEATRRAIVRAAAEMGKTK